jgi:hypothetical protein
MSCCDKSSCASRSICIALWGLAVAVVMALFLVFLMVVHNFSLMEWLE